MSSRDLEEASLGHVLTERSKQLKTDPSKAQAKLSFYQSNSCSLLNTQQPGGKSCPVPLSSSHTCVGLR